MTELQRLRKLELRMIEQRRRAGKSKSPLKQEAARQNGKRPKKKKNE